MSGGIRTEALKILIASAPKTGNTWLKAILSALFDLPVVSLDGRFSLSQARSVGSRWVAHQHYRPTPDIVRWAKTDNVHIVTMIRHPADALVSYYHYARNYPENFREDVRMREVIEAEAARRRQMESGDEIREDELLGAIEDRLIADISISISWITRQYGVTVRYEDLLLDSQATISRLASPFSVVSNAAVQAAVDQCELAAMKKNAGENARFFRKGHTGEWRRALPERIIRHLRDEEPYRSQIKFLGYKMDDQNDSGSETPASAPQASERIAIGDHFANGVLIAPFIKLLFAAKNQQWFRIDSVGVGTFFEWLNAPAEEDPYPDSIPLVTNLGASIYRSRPDLPRVHPDIFGSGRVGFCDWFLRYTIEEYQLDRVFLTPVALSWIRNVHAMT
jgi:hypothetical protein